MAKQIAGLCFLEGTIDDLTFYQMDGQYYCRAKSSLTAERVKKSETFKNTMRSANRLAHAARIGRTIYQALPPRWRQFWMYRSFTGEAFTLLKHTSLTEEAIIAQLRACYVDYWDQRKAADPENILWQPVPLKIRKPRKYSEASIQRRLDKLMASRTRAEQVAERKRLEEERKQAWIEKLAARAAARAEAAALTEQVAGENEVEIIEDWGTNAFAGAVEGSVKWEYEHHADVPMPITAISHIAFAEPVAPSVTWATRDTLDLKLYKPAPALIRARSRSGQRPAAGRVCWYIDQRGLLQQQSVPEVSRKRPTGTRTMFDERQCAQGTSHRCDSS